MFFKLFSFCCSNCNLFSSMRAHIQFLVFQKKNISTDNICHRCFVCWTLCVFINVFEWSFFAFLFLFFQNNREVTDPNGFQMWPASTDLLEIRIQLKLHNIQMIAKDFNASSSLCFRKSLVIFKFFFSSFLWLTLPKDSSFWFCNYFLVNYQKLFR